MTTLYSTFAFCEAAMYSRSLTSARTGRSPLLWHRGPGNLPGLVNGSTY